MKITQVGKTQLTTEYENRGPLTPHTEGGEKSPTVTETQGADAKAGTGQPDNFDTGLELPPGEIRISVRGLVEFILRHGDIDNRHQVSPDNAMQEGGRIHRMIQKRMGAEYQPEVPLKYTLYTRGYTLIVEGRADGILNHDGQVTVDEIKGTYRDVSRMRAPMPLHVAQAKCYAYMYALKVELQQISVRMTYCNMETEDLRYFYEDYTFDELTEWFEALIAEYRRWADYTWRWRGIRQSSIEGLSFPFPYRDGQKELVTNVYKTIYHKRKLFLEAPTGVGKTISTVFPAVQAMGKGMGDKLFYLTAKTITRTVAEEALNILRQKGLRMKSVILTAKEKICFMDEVECNPEHCPYAKGHYDRINDAVFDLLTSEEAFSRETIETYAAKHQVCPFEMCLDMTLFADAIICDYNYLFDPHVYLKRFFGDGTGGNYIFLIDEAHNLLERGREMYSAVLWKEQFMELRQELKQTILSEISKKPSKSNVSGQMTFELTTELTPVSYTIDEDNSPPVGHEGHGAKSILVGEGYADKMVYQLEKCNTELLNMKRECEGCRVVESIDGFVQHLLRLHSTMDDYLSEQESGLPVRDLLLEFYFEVSHFLQMYELVDENYVKYTQLGEDGSFLIKLFCVNPRENLKTCMLRGRSTILFSATFLPIQYYKKLLGGDEEDYEVYAKSVFNPAKRALFIANDVTSKYTRRSEDEFYSIARYIEEIVKNRHGNYMVFCPSYAFLRTIYEKYEENFGGEERQCIIQSESMSEADREEFLARFQGIPPSDADHGNTSHGNAIEGIAMEVETEESCLIGFCVLGGIFSEGIDLKNDRLIGAIIVGTGLPQVCNEREILKLYFDENGENGFDYSYRYPGMNKVLQAAGRVIRTVEDVGIIALLDERFLQFAYRKMFPREWEYFETVTVDTVAKRVERFWNEWL